MEAVAGLPASRPTSQSFMMALSGLQYFWSHAKVDPHQFFFHSLALLGLVGTSLLWLQLVLQRSTIIAVAPLLDPCCPVWYLLLPRNTTFASRFSTLDHLQALVPCCAETRLTFFLNITPASQLFESWRLGHLGHQPVPIHLSNWWPKTKPLPHLPVNLSTSYAALCALLSLFPTVRAV